MWQMSRAINPKRQDIKQNDDLENLPNIGIEEAPLLVQGPSGNKRKNQAYYTSSREVAPQVSPTNCVL